MKRYLLVARYRALQSILLISAGLIAMASFAQDKKEIDVNVNTNKNDFWGQPWVWVVGAAIFILLLVAILRGGRRGRA